VPWFSPYSLALVLLKPEYVGQVNEHAIRNHAIEAAGISHCSVLLHVSFVKRLLKTSVGKMNKQGMRANPDALSE
jgi:fatty-acyl-CoA synthase